MSAVATPSKGSISKYATASYFDLIDEANKPIADRKELPIGRGGKLTVVRRQHIVESDLEAYRAQLKGVKANPEKGIEAVEPDVFPNPFNQSQYFYIIEALKHLGINEAHEMSAVYREIKRQMSLAATRQGEGDKATTAWERFAGKESRSENGLDVSGKVRQNIEVLQRVTGINAYGLKINQIGKDVLGGKGACIDLIREDDNGPVSVRLNTKPTNFLVLVPTMGSLKGQSISIALPQNDIKNRRKTDVEVVTARKLNARLAEANTPAPKAKRKAAKKATPKSEPAVETVVDTAVADATVAETATPETETETVEAGELVTA